MLDIYNRLKRWVRQADSVLVERFRTRVHVLFVVLNEIGYIEQRPILQRLKQDQRFCVRVLFDQLAGSFLPTDKRDDLTVQNAIPEFQARVHKWDYVITTDITYFWPYRNHIKVILNHGSGLGSALKASNYESTPKDWAYTMMKSSEVGIICLPALGWLDQIRRSYSNLMIEQQKALFVLGTEKIIPTNHPMLNISIDLGKRMRILLTSHWTPHSIFRDFGLEIIPALLALDECLEIVVTAHPKLWTTVVDDGFNGFALEARIKAFAEITPRVTFINTGNAFELFKSADLLICDHSSVRIEFSAMNRPVILYRRPEWKAISPITEELYVNSSCVFHSLSQLPDAVSEALNVSTEREKWNTLLFDYFKPYRANQASILCDLFAKIGPIGSLRSKKWTQVKHAERQMLSELSEELQQLTKRIDDAVELKG